MGWLFENHTTQQVVTLAAMLGLFGCGEPTKVVPQPLEFSHQSHMKEELTCDGCHRGAEKRDVAGFPRLKGCMLCHEEAVGEHPDEPKVRDYYKQKREVPWVRVNGNPGHVFFSHRAHAGAEIGCEECHGEVGKFSLPIVSPTPALHSMDACMDCHERQQASNDCLECHQ